MFTDPGFSEGIAATFNTSAGDHIPVQFHGRVERIPAGESHVGLPGESDDMAAGLAASARTIRDPMGAVLSRLDFGDDTGGRLVPVFVEIPDIRSNSGRR